MKLLYPTTLMLSIGHLVMAAPIATNNDPKLLSRAAAPAPQFLGMSKNSVLDIVPFIDLHSRRRISGRHGHSHQQYSKEWNELWSRQIDTRQRHEHRQQRTRPWRT